MIATQKANDDRVELLPLYNVIDHVQYNGKNGKRIPIRIREVITSHDYYIANSIIENTHIQFVILINIYVVFIILIRKYKDIFNG